MFRPITLIIDCTIHLDSISGFHNFFLGREGCNYVPFIFFIYLLVLSFQSNMHYAYFPRNPVANKNYSSPYRHQTISMGLNSGHIGHKNNKRSYCARRTSWNKCVTDSHLFLVWERNINLFTLNALAIQNSHTQVFFPSINLYNE